MSSFFPWFVQKKSLAHFQEFQGDSKNWSAAIQVIVINKLIYNRPYLLSWSQGDNAVYSLSITTGGIRGGKPLVNFGAFFRGVHRDSIGYQADFMVL